MHPIRAGDRFFALPLDGKVLLGDEPLERGESIRPSSILLRGSLYGGSKVKAQRAPLSITAAIVAATLGADASRAEESSAMLSLKAMQEIAQVEAEIDRIETQTIERLCSAAGQSGPANRVAR